MVTTNSSQENLVFVTQNLWGCKYKLIIGGGAGGLTNFNSQIHHLAINV